MISPYAWKPRKDIFPKTIIAPQPVITGIAMPPWFSSLSACLKKISCCCLATFPSWIGKLRLPAKQINSPISLIPNAHSHDLINSQIRGQYSFIALIGSPTNSSKRILVSISSVFVASSLIKAQSYSFNFAFNFSFVFSSP